MPAGRVERAEDSVVDTGLKLSRSVVMGPLKEVAFALQLCPVAEAVAEETDEIRHRSAPRRDRYARD